MNFLKIRAFLKGGVYDDREKNVELSVVTEIVTLGVAKRRICDDVASDNYRNAEK